MFLRKKVIYKMPGFPHFSVAIQASHKGSPQGQIGAIHHSSHCKRATESNRAQHNHKVSPNVKTSQAVVNMFI